MRTARLSSILFRPLNSLPAFLLAAVTGFSLLGLPACNTTAGVGRDVQKVGRTIEREAVQHR
ncbi:MAG: entericidin A/B family lipoprotein [Verrucomicrobiales bacterium]